MFEPSSKLRVLLVAPMPPPHSGGIANWTGMLHRHLTGHPDVELRVVDTSVRWRRETNHSLPVRLTGGSLQALRDAWRTHRQMKRRRPHVLHLCTSGGPSALKDWLIARSARRCGVPCLIQYRMGRLPDVIRRNGWEWKWIRRGMRLADMTVVLDERSLAMVHSALPEAPVAILPNMVKIEEIDRIGSAAAPSSVCPGATRILFIGHVVPAKGVRELVSACLQLVEKNIVLEIAGTADPKFKNELETLAAQSGRSDWCRFHGTLEHDDVIALLHQADIFVLPSYTEGAPNTILEAMACRRAIVGTTVGAIPELLNLGGADACGIGVPPREVAPLARELARLIDQPPLRRELAAKARCRAELVYDIPVSCGRLIDLWRSLAGRQGSAEG
jgi:glycosyltransferase involved in cell wall biosynthesis